MGFDFNQVADLAKDNKARSVIQLSQWELEDFEPMNNNVLVEIDPSEYEVIGGWLVYIDEMYTHEKDRYNAGEHTIRHGKVVRHPKEFIYHEHGQQKHKTTIEIQLGDDVFFPGSESSNCPLIESNGRLYLVLDYEVLYVAKREVNGKFGNIYVDDKWFQVIPLNGYLMCKKYYDDAKSPLSITMKNINKKVVDVVYAGSPVEYRQSKGGTHPTGKEVKAGDRLFIYNHDAMVMLESDMHLHFDKANNYRMVQRKYVMAIL